MDSPGRHLEAGACRRSLRYTPAIRSRFMIAPTWVPSDLRAHVTCLEPRLRDLDMPMLAIQFLGRRTCLRTSRFRWMRMACPRVTETLSQCRFAVDCTEWVACTPRMVRASHGATAINLQASGTLISLL